MNKTNSRRRSSKTRTPGQQGENSHRSSPPNHASSKARFDRYVTLAREAAALGNSVDAENYYQHAEHYFRLMNPSSGEGRGR